MKTLEQIEKDRPEAEYLLGEVKKHNEEARLHRNVAEKALQDAALLLCPWQIGDRVTYEGKKGIVFQINSKVYKPYYEVVFHSLKKDGTPSKNNTRVWYEAKLQLTEESE